MIHAILISIILITSVGCGHELNMHIKCDMCGESIIRCKAAEINEFLKFRYFLSHFEKYFEILKFSSFKTLKIS